MLTNVPLTLKCALLVSAVSLIVAGCRSSEFIEDPAEIEGASQAVEELRAEFLAPPDSARSLVYWHWADGNVTKDGITADLEWLREQGLAGVQLFDVAVGSGQVVETPAVFHEDVWMEMLEHALSEADRLGLEFNIHSSPGWSQTGGPWVSPSQAMKKFTWSETLVEGSWQSHVKLNAPPKNPGFFQDLVSPFAAGETAEDRIGDPIFEQPFYKDEFVFAVPVPVQEIAMSDVGYEVFFNGEAIDDTLLIDERYREGLEIARIDGQSEITFEYAAPVTLTSFTLATVGDMPHGVLEAKSANGAWTELAVVPEDTHELVRIPVSTFSFPEIETKTVRLSLSEPRELRPFQAMLSSGPPETYSISEAKLSFGKVHRFEAKAGFEFLYDYALSETADLSTAIDPETVIDLTTQLSDDGVLNWNVPDGQWRILRLGYSLTGRKNQPAVDAGSGLEVDKLNRAHVEAYLDGYLGPIGGQIENAFGDRGIQHIALDSWEAKTSNWTSGIFDEFEKRRGYDPRPFAPALMGFVVGSSSQSDRFLWDWRATIGELIEENHNGTIQRFANERNMGVYAESMGVRMNAMADGMKMKAMAEVPMAEFWYEPLDAIDPRFIADVREAASVANMYGKRAAAAEAFTTFPDKRPWGQGPRELKPVADAFFVEGVNKIVFHSYVHQPSDEMRPGLTLWQFGQFLSRHESWAEQARGFFDYLARVSHMLQQGRHVADIGIFLGEGAPVSVPFWKDHTAYKPDGYDFNYVDVDTILNYLAVEDGVFRSEGGQGFRVLVIPNHISALSDRVAARLAEFSDVGGIVYGAVPDQTPSLSDEMMRASSDRGREKPAVDVSLQDLLLETGTGPDILLPDGARVKWKHRATPELDIYFLSNLSDKEFSDMISFRDARASVSLWWPETGDITKLDIASGAETNALEIKLAAFESVFVVFSEMTLGDALSYREDASLSRLVVDAPWRIEFQGSAEMVLQETDLFEWSASANPELKYFSGTARYTNTVSVPDDVLSSGQRSFVNMGDVGQIASVYVNGEYAGTDWIAPYRVRIDQALKPGDNEIWIDVTNLWANRIIGDRLQSDQKSSANIVSFEPYAANTAYAALTGRTVSDDDLLSSGLIGPVVLEVEGE